MRSRWSCLVLALAVAGCQDKKPDAPPAGGTSASSGTGSVSTEATAGQAAGARPVAGQVHGKAFAPDQITLEGKTLRFRQGKDFFPDKEVKFDLPEGSRAKLEGREWKFQGDKFENPTLSVAATEGKGIPKTDFVFPKDYTMTLKVTKQSAKEVAGEIDLKVGNPANTHLAGTFTAVVKKTPEDPLDADDAPYVQGRIVFVGEWKEERLAAGFHGTGTDGKPYSNMAGTKVTPDGAGGATSLSFEPQLTSLTNTAKGGPGFRHTKLKPGEYVVYVRRNDVLAAWKKVTVKPDDQLTVDLTIDPAKTGEVVVTLPDAEANDDNPWHLSLIPAELDEPGKGYHYAFNAAEMKKGQKTATVKGVPAGKYRAVRGKSEAVVEVTVGKSAAVTLVRTDPKQK